MYIQRFVTIPIETKQNFIFFNNNEILYINNLKTIFFKIIKKNIYNIYNNYIQLLYKKCILNFEWDFNEKLENIN